MHDLVDQLQSEGRYTFTKELAMVRLGLPEPATQAFLRRLIRKGRIVSPVRGFYVVVSAEYATAGSPPVPWFLDDLCGYLETDYYAGLLTAAALHGAGHQQPLRFQVILPQSRRRIRAGRSEIGFHGSSHFHTALTKEVKTPTGYMRVSAPESTALDLVRFIKACGGASLVTTVLSELGERLDRDVLAELLQEEQTPILQRLGFLLETVGLHPLAEPLREVLACRIHRRIPLVPGDRSKELLLDPFWKVEVADDLEPET
jgi:predicted transcriptional regulator of viral defense system